MAPTRGASSALSAMRAAARRPLALPMGRLMSTESPDASARDTTSTASQKDGTSPSPPRPAAPVPTRRFPDFHPRTKYEPSPNIVRTYFLGHHRAALDRMRRVLATVGLVIECRDLRIPTTAWNPLLETSVQSGGVVTSAEAGVDGGGLAAATLGRRKAQSSAATGATGKYDADDNERRSRIIVYTKRDLVVDPSAPPGSPASSISPTHADLQRLANLHRNDADAVLFLGSDKTAPDGPDDDNEHAGRSSRVAAAAAGRREANKLVAAVRAVARRQGQNSLTGLRALIVGMPNAGKSTLLNRLRAHGMADADRRSRVAATGAQPGVTRNLGTPVRVLEEDGDDEEGVGGGNGVLVMDTPGVFVPYVGDAESMVKLALVGCVRGSTVKDVELADYLLFQLNQRDPGLYVDLFGMDGPTDDVDVLLDAVARRTGKLKRKGDPSHEGAALHFLHAWRRGKLGRFCLDPLDGKSLTAAREAALAGPPLSMSQARKRDKEQRRERNALKRSAKMAAMEAEAATAAGGGGERGL